MEKSKWSMALEVSGNIMKGKQLYISSTPILPEGKIDKPVVFLLRSCVTPSVKFRLKTIGYEIMPRMRDEQRHINEINDYLDKEYISFQNTIAKTLNQIHKRDYPISFWEIPLASWLLHYLHILFDRYFLLNMAVRHYGKENITLLTCRYDLSAPLDAMDFKEKSTVTEQAVSCFYGIVAKEMGMKVKEFTSTEKCEDDFSVRMKSVDIFSSSFYVRLLNKFKETFFCPIPFGFFQGRDILMSSYEFNRREKLIFARKLKASFFPIRKKIKLGSQNINRRILSDIKAQDEFEKIAINLLPRFMPKHLLEHFESYKALAKKWNDFKIYFSESYWHSNMLFCFAASLGKMKDAKIVGCQHGGGYGQTEKCPSEFIERRFSDFYITWGWTDSYYSGAQLVPLSQPYLSRCLDKYIPRFKTALWVGSIVSRQLVRFVKPLPDSSDNYLGSREVFISHFDRNVRRQLVYRPRPYFAKQGGVGSEKEFFKRYPEVKVKCVGNLSEALRKVKLCVCDHQSTSFMEGFVFNIPTIIFWDSKLLDERKSAIPKFDLLRNAGILFHDPAEAAKRINAIWDDVQGWWMHPDRQNARREFMETFCRAETNWQKKWIDTFENILEKQSAGSAYVGQ